MYENAEVYVTKEEKEKLQSLIKEIGDILNKYPYSNDYTSHFVTTMSKAKCYQNDLEKTINLLQTKG